MQSEQRNQGARLQPSTGASSNQPTQEAPPGLIDLSNEPTAEDQAIVAHAMKSFKRVTSKLSKGDTRIERLRLGYDPYPNLAELPRSPITRQCKCWLINAGAQGMLCDTLACANSSEYVVCPPDCTSRHRCANQRFDKHNAEAPHEVFVTQRTGLGVKASEVIPLGAFVMEYMGEVIRGDEFKKRLTQDTVDGKRDFYFLSIRDDYFIDGRLYSNSSRFINHSCQPNCVIEVWKKCGIKRAALYALKEVGRFEELTFDYNWWNTFDASNFECRCGAERCTRQGV
ncbi:hypothetical protein H257_05868 [Aphanomyces astaci]|uniref:SET domain-containing protein n=2 Tax=Aphanomyces astaci TaxID=112090 RepID=W4GQM3_APHAT|nr:hypothetical protein H257_05868 [Aphanomyces astaci]ETV81314.1 hypothetical protein H257_05868 [Aphanomyces astaci]|eukprot:XP_009829172.1 hypothetical protein H257_05868 [Aphanomyces astaci]